MNLLKGFKREIKNKKKYFVFISICILLYSVAIYFKIDFLKDKALINMISTLDGQEGMAGDMAFIFIYTPILFFGINSYLINIEKESFIIKMNSRRTIFNSHVIFVLLISMIISTIMVGIGYSIGWIYAGGFKHIWPQSHEYYKLPEFRNLDVVGILESTPIYVIILKTFLIKTLGFSVLGIVILILKTCIKNSGVLGLVVMIIPFVDSNFLNGVVFTKKFSLTILSWVSSSDYVLNVLYLTFLLTALYLIGREIYKNKDFIGKGY